MSLFELLNLMTFRPSDCFYGEMRHEFVNDRLSKEGEFLLRTSNNDFFASVKWKNQIRHFQTKQKVEGPNTTYSFDSKTFCPTFDNLVRYHYINKVPLGDDDKTLLQTPVPVPKYQYFETDIDVLKRVGGGSFGDVFKVKLKSENIFLAMKVLKDDVSEDDRKSFLKEIQMMRCMRHANVVKFVGVISPVKESKQLKILLEYVNQGSLLRLLRRGKVLTRGKHKISLESSMGLKYLHLHTIIHRDIAARNILIQMTADGTMTVKVSDFGMSRIDETGKGYELRTARKLPLKWMAPECFEKRIWTKASDVWSFGLLIWEIFENGQEPYSVSSVPQAPTELSKYICTGNLNARPAEVSDGLWLLMKSCWITDYSKRVNMTDVSQRLQTLFDEYVQSAKINRSSISVQAGPSGREKGSDRKAAKSDPQSVVLQ